MTRGRYRSTNRVAARPCLGAACLLAALVGTAALAQTPAAENTPLSQAHARIYGRDSAPRPEGPVRLGPGPHLFLDDYLIESSRNVRRVVESPRRDPAIRNPIVTGKADGCFQPYMTVLRDSQTGRFRLWYGHRAGESEVTSHIGYLESDDGVDWTRPPRLLPDPGPIQFGTAVVDDGPGASDPAKRYTFAWWHGGGLRLATSADGFTFHPISANPVIYHNHDITGLFFDPIRRRYTATISVYREGDAWQGKRRLTMQSSSRDLTQWDPPHYVLVPDYAVDEGELQFYALDGYLRRGDLLVGMVKVLRDDLKADQPPDPPEAYGVGYTTLAWTRDGETWIRDTTHYFDPDPAKGAWDHAHAWIDEQTPIGDMVHLYYGGYARGHKVNRFEERQIGLVKIRRDRYVAREAVAGEGEIRTPLLLLEFGAGLTLNVDAAKGSVSVHALDAGGIPIPGFAPGDSRPVTTDSVAAPVIWKSSVETLRGRPVRLVFTLKRARLYGVNL